MRDMTRSEIHRWFQEFPQGNPYGGPPYGERNDPVSLTTAASMVGLISGGVGIAKAVGIIGGDTPAAAAAPVSAPAPTVTPPTLMPSPDDDAVKLAKKKSMVTQLSRRGRQSTILSDPTAGSSDLLGA